MSYNRAPAPDIAPWIGRLYATAVDMPTGHRVDCGLLYDTSVFRFQLSGTWQAGHPGAVLVSDRCAMFFGPQTRRMPVSVTGPFVSVGFTLRPGTGPAILGVKTGDYVDRLVLVDELGLPGDAALALLDPDGTPDQWFDVFETFIRQIAYARGGAFPDPVSTRFEAAALTDPTFAIAEFAEEIGITQRRLERIIHRDFGMSPKQVLRRARALDMAAVLRGVGDDAEAPELSLRYYDQSHLIREFTEFFGMTPSQFVAEPQPLLTMALESRQARRLELIERLSPGAKRPWE